MGCTRCGGTGVIVAYLHVQGGICFRCRGSGEDPKRSKLLWPKEIYLEKRAGDKKIVLRVKKDLSGRFLGYSVYVEGAPLGASSFQKFKEAKKAFEELIRREKARRAAGKKNDTEVVNVVT